MKPWEVAVCLSVCASNFNICPVHCRLVSGLLGSSRHSMAQDQDRHIAIPAGQQRIAQFSKEWRAVLTSGIDVLVRARAIVLLGHYSNSIAPAGF